jgi:predicted RNase H-like nuclease (RuvC/YqgF family)
MAKVDDQESLDNGTRKDTGRAGAGNGSHKARAGSGDEDALRAQLQKLERENRRLRERCERAELEVADLEKRVRGVENTLSFRLGYALIHATKSMDGLRGLPSELAELSRESRRRKREDPLAGRAALTLVRSPVRAARELWDLAKSAEGGDSNDD